MRRTESKRWILTALVGVAVIAVAGLAAAGVLGDGADPAPRSPTSRGAPDVGFERWDGSRGALADYRGIPLVLNFWASWCPPCAAEMPGFERVDQQFAGEVAFLGLDLQDERGPAEALVARTGVTYDLGLDPDGRIFQAFGGIGMPTTVFISAEGEILDRHTGILTEEELTERIERLFFGP